MCEMKLDILRRIKGPHEGFLLPYEMFDEVEQLFPHGKQNFRGVFKRMVYLVFITIQFRTKLPFLKK